MDRIENAVRVSLVYAAVRLVAGCDERHVPKPGRAPSTRLLVATVLATLARG